MKMERAECKIRGSHPGSPGFRLFHFCFLIFALLSRRVGLGPPQSRHEKDGGLKPTLHAIVQVPLALVFVLITCLSPELGMQFARRFLRPRPRNTHHAIRTTSKRKETPMAKKGTHKQRRHAGAKHPRPYESTPLTREVWRIVRQFRNVPPSEEAFYLKLQALPARKRAALRDWWKLKDDWALFARLCRF